MLKILCLFELTNTGSFNFCFLLFLFFTFFLLFCCFISHASHPFSYIIYTVWGDTRFRFELEELGNNTLTEFLFTMYLCMAELFFWIQKLGFSCMSGKGSV